MHSTCFAAVSGNCPASESRDYRTATGTGLSGSRSDCGWVAAVNRSYITSVSCLLDAQNPDGGWGYRGGGSWTEPTALALLAQVAENHNSNSTERGLRWLDAAQRADGAWPPRPSVEHGTWVTALCVLVLADQPDSPSLYKGVDWLLKQTGRESSLVYRLRRRLLGLQNEQDGDSVGWPWFPETAAWVAPTAVTILALRKANRRLRREDVARRVEMGRKFLRVRMCQDGGWNHGSSRALGYEANSYPETTGLALLALHGAPPARLAKSIATAERHLRTCRSLEGLSWLRLGLLAHLRPLAGKAEGSAVCHTVLEASLWILARAAANGRNVFLE